MSSPVPETTPCVGAGMAFRENGGVAGAIDLPNGYQRTLDELKSEVGDAQLRAQHGLNAELIAHYWAIGSRILAQQKLEK